MTLFGKLLLLAILCFVWRTIRHVRNTELPDIEYSVSYDENGNIEYRV